MMAHAKAVLRVDNDDVIVTEWQFAPGTATGEHRHNYDYVVVPLTGALCASRLHQAKVSQRCRLALPIPGKPASSTT